eukprot:7815782-Pyramimonas_sp.AAC.1
MDGIDNNALQTLWVSTCGWYGRPAGDGPPEPPCSVPAGAELCDCDCTVTVLRPAGGGPAEQPHAVPAGAARVAGGQADWLPDGHAGHADDLLVHLRLRGAVGCAAHQHPAAHGAVGAAAVGHPAARGAVGAVGVTPAPPWLRGLLHFFHETGSCVGSTSRSVKSDPLVTVTVKVYSQGLQSRLTVK